MIESINNQRFAALPPIGGASNEPGATGGGFSAALDAERKAEQARQARTNELDAIKSKGFSAWVRDTQIEALKEKLRKQVMADMGIDEDSLSKLSSVMQEILEKKIQEEIDRRMQEQTAKDENGQDKTAVATAQQTGKNDRDGKNCPVIPAVSWPGGVSVF